VSDRSGSERKGFGGLGAKGIAGIAIAILILVFIVINGDDTAVSFIFFTATVPLWVALSIAAAGGLIAGLLIGRRRYRA
jgi:uncharacterized integral membrane protein